MDNATKLARVGKPCSAEPQAVNPAIIRASTVLYPDTATMREHRTRRETGERLFTYGARGTPTAFALQDALSLLEEGDRAFLYPSGLFALAALFLAYTSPGDHVAIIDTVYPPVRRVAKEHFGPRGIQFSYFAPDAESLRASIRANTRLVLVESPGSNTFEIIDLQEMARISHSHGALLAVDNTWAAGVFFKPLNHGADISIQAATKYICGYSDVMMGAAIVREGMDKPLFELSNNFGICVSPDDCYTALRGMRSLHARMRTHENNALQVAEWLADRNEVDIVLHPALPSCPGHEIWKRDFTGSSGLFSFGLNEQYASRTEAFIDALSLFGIGSSWGGYESLALPVDPGGMRTATQWSGPRQLVRLHIGQESVGDLIADLSTAFDAVAS